MSPVGTGVAAGALFVIGVCAGYRAEAADVYYTYAPVTRVEPIREVREIPVDDEVCVQTATQDQIARDRDLAGDVSRTESGLGLTETLRRDIKRRQERSLVTRCQKVTRYEKTLETVSFRVTYRYRNQEYVQRMDKHPGDRIRVQVRVEPMTQWRVGSDTRLGHN